MSKMGRATAGACSSADHQGISDTTAKSLAFFDGGAGPEPDMLWNPEWWRLMGSQPTDGTQLPPPPSAP